MRSVWPLIVVALCASTVAPLGAQVPGEVRGRVTADAQSGGAPIANAIVEIAGRGERVRSASDGGFRIRGLEPRPYVLHVTAVGFRAREVDVEIQNGRTTQVDVVLDAAPRVLDLVAVNAKRDSAIVGGAVFEREAIESSGRRDVGELIQSVAGVVVTQAGGPGSATHVSIRGSSANQVLVLVDGVSINSAVTGDADLSRIPLENVERVIVHTGAQSARFGQRALAGVVEIQTRRAVNEASISLRAGAWGEQNAAAVLAATTRVAETAIGGSLAGDARTVRGDFMYDVPAVRGGGTAHRVNSGSTSRQLLGTVTFDRDAWNATLRASAQRLERGLAGSIVQPSLTGRETQGRADVGADVSWRNAIASWTANTTVTHERATFRDPSPSFGVAFDDTINADGLTGRTEATVGDDSRSVSIGGEARVMDLRASILAPAAPHWQRTLGAFGGVHASRGLGTSDTRAAIDLEARVDESSLADVAVSPRARLSMTRDWLVASVSLGAGYAPPSLADQFFHEGVLVRPNPALQPERTRHDLELRLAARDVDARFARLDAEVGAYRADVDDMVLWFPDFRFIWSPSNFDVRRSGWEASGGATFAHLPVDVHGTLNHTDVAYSGSVLGGQVTYRPRVTGDVAVGIGGSAVRADLVSRYVGERRTVAGSPLNTLAPYWRSDARVSSAWRWRSLVATASVGVENVFDESASMLVDYPFPGRSWSVALRLRRAGTQ